MTYKGVNAILEAHDEKTRQEYKELVPMFETMADLHRILLKHRHQRGAIDFEAPEAKIIVDENGHPTDIQLRDRGLSERMIESFMLAANETVAKHYDLMHVPFLYRIHEHPDTERIKNFAEFLSVFGINMPGDLANVEPKMLQKVLKQVAGTPEEQMVQTMMLRSMQQAKPLWAGGPVLHPLYVADSSLPGYDRSPLDQVVQGKRDYRRGQGQVPGSPSGNC